MILALFFARGKRGATCPNCGSTNTVTHDDGYVWDTQREQWRHVDQPADFDSLWTDERISNMVQAASCDVEYTDADGMIDYRQYVLAGDVCRLLRTMRDEYEIMLSRR